jgi:hypothetical protein
MLRNLIWVVLWIQNSTAYINYSIHEIHNIGINFKVWSSKTIRTDILARCRQEEIVGKGVLTLSLKVISSCKIKLIWETSLVCEYFNSCIGDKLFSKQQNQWLYPSSSEQEYLIYNLMYPCNSSYCWNS